jgi:hypothetical protein
VKANIVSRVVVVIGVLAFFAPVAQAGTGGGGTPPGLPGGTPASTCRVVDGEDVGVGVTLVDNFGQGGREVLVRSGRLLCTSIISVTPLPLQRPILDVSAAGTPNALRCYVVTPITPGGGKDQTAAPQPDTATLRDGVHYDSGNNFVEQTVQVGALQLLCLPAIVEVEGP